MSDRVLVSLDGPVAHVRLNRADKRNGLDLAMFEALAAAGERLQGERGVRAVVLSGEGKAFCAGLDWAAFMGGGVETAQRLLERRPGASANLAQQACWVWAELPVPVIAAVRGAAFGGGLQLALACDLRLVASDAQLSVMEVKYGLIPDMTASRTLLRLVRPDLARELLYTGRIVKAEEAVQIGLATRLVEDPIEEATALARQIATQSPDAVRRAKRLALEAQDLPLGASLELETRLQMELFGTANQLEAAMAAMEKRAARFE